MESVGDVAAEGEDAITWIGDHSAQLVSFGLSFVIIAMFWLSHHRLFSAVERVTDRLLWLLAAWMLSIVWLPVATAISGLMSATDPIAKLLYIGSMSVTALLSLAIRVYLQRHPDLHEVPHRALREGMAEDLAMAVLFAVALAITLLFPAVGYYSMLVMLASPLAQALFSRMLGVSRRS
ncbi:TMEM175 family protein [Leucobacter soli]